MKNFLKNFFIIFGAIMIIGGIGIPTVITIFNYECPHKQTKILNAVSPTCTQDGLSQGEVCLKCNQTVIQQKTIFAIGHQLNEGTIITKASCTQDGQIVYVCTVCGYEESKTVPAEHTYKEPVITKTATCTESGINTYICTVCQQTYEETVSAEHYFIGDDCINCGSYKSPIDPNCWYEYNNYPALKVQNCEIAAFRDTGTPSMGIYYPVCQSCHITLKEVNAFMISRGETQKESYNCSCGAETTIVLVLGR